MEKALTKDAKFWNKNARKYAGDSIVDMAGYERTIAAISSRLKSHHTLLEIGCGTGMTALKLAPFAAKILATDISNEMIEIARERSLESGAKNVDFAVAEVSTTNWAQHHFDVVLGLNILHLVPSMGETLSVLHSSLKPGGIFISKTPCLKMMNPLIRLAIPVMQAIGKAPSVSALSPDEIEHAFAQANFKLLETAWHGEKGRDTRPYIVAQKLV